MSFGYELQIYITLARAGVWFFLLAWFGWLLLRRYGQDLTLIDQLIHGWGIFGGVCLFLSFLLSATRLFDFIGTILGIGLILTAVLKVQSYVQAKVEKSKIDKAKGENSKFKKSRAEKSDLVKDTPSVASFLVLQIQFIERFKSVFQSPENRRGTYESFKLHDIFYSTSARHSGAIVFLIAASVFWLLPVLEQASPSSRYWFYELDFTKLTKVEHSFTSLPNPPGFYLISSLFSTLAQISPERILYISGAATGFILHMLIYWVLYKILSDSQKKESQFDRTKQIGKDKSDERISVQILCSALFGSIFFALTQTYLHPVVFTGQMMEIRILLAFSFAILTIYSFMGVDKWNRYTALFAINFLATAFTDFHVWLLILLPIVLILWLFKSHVHRQKGKVYQTLWLGSLTLTIAVVYGLALLQQGVSIRLFLFHNLMMLNLLDVKEAATFGYDFIHFIYLAVGIFMTTVTMIGWRRGFHPSGRLLLAGGFTVYIAIYPYLKFWSSEWIHPVAFTYLYLILLSFTAGLVFWYVVWLFNQLYFHLVGRQQRWFSPILLAGFLACLIAYGNISFGNSQLSKPVPDGFIKAYHQLKDERIPFTYSTVWPNVMEPMARHRHNHLGYSFFLDDFLGIDEDFYHLVQTSELPVEELEFEYRPKPSIFIFVAKPPYLNLQRSVLSNEVEHMQQLREWVEHYQQLEGRSIRIFWEDTETLVYELIYQTGTSRVRESLREIHNDRPWWLYDR